MCIFVPFCFIFFWGGGGEQGKLTHVPCSSLCRIHSPRGGPSTLGGPQRRWVQVFALTFGLAGRSGFRPASFRARLFPRTSQAAPEGKQLCERRAQNCRFLWEVTHRVHGLPAVCEDKFSGETSLDGFWRTHSGSELFSGG